MGVRGGMEEEGERGEGYPHSTGPMWQGSSAGMFYIVFWRTSWVIILPRRAGYEQKRRNVNRIWGGGGGGGA